jgi:PTS system fructose-specific IIC component
MQSGSKIALAVVLGMLISVDFGGPVNKVAYLFGVAALATEMKSGHKSEVMAAVSAGCITPPLTTAIATILFRKRFAEAERQAGLTNIILGAFHITEGAIPFAAKRP